MPIRMYHPNLEPPNNEAEVMNEAQVAIYEESGWKRAPEPAEPEPGLAPQPVEYAPVEAKPASKSAKRTAVKESSD
jgi:hypothetical protein